jgi:uncharacterized membrane protein
MPRHLPTSDSRAHLGRRSLVRTGVTAAWAVPAVTVAAAAPAFAACSGHSDLSQSSHGTASRSGKTVTITLTLSNGGATTSGLALSVSGPDTLHTLDEVSATGWSTASAGGAGSLTLTSVATTQLVCGAAPTAVTFTVKLHSNAASQQLSFVVTAASGVGYTFAVTV